MKKHEITTLKKQIIVILEQWEKDEVWKGYPKLSLELSENFKQKYIDIINIDIRETLQNLRQAMKELKKQNIVHISYTRYEDEMTFAGSGYFLTQEYYQIYKRLEKLNEL